jgi:hypothetical protein
VEAKSINGQSLTIDDGGPPSVWTRIIPKRTKISGLLPKNIKARGLFVPVFSDFFLHRRGFVTTRTTYRSQATIRFHSLSLFLSTLNCYRAVIMSPVQTLPSFNLAVHADHYKTVLPNISYPSRPITHIPWSGSSAPLLFSVGQTILFLVICRILNLFCPQKTTRLVMSITASTPNFSVQVSYVFPSI